LFVIGKHQYRDKEPEAVIEVELPLSALRGRDDEDKRQDLAATGDLQQRSSADEEDPS